MKKIEKDAAEADLGANHYPISKKEILNLEETDPSRRENGTTAN
jgi:hypothetical protein